MRCLRRWVGAEAAGHDSVDVLFDDNVLEASGLVVDDLVSAVVEHLTDAEVKTAVAESARRCGPHGTPAFLSEGW